MTLPDSFTQYTRQLMGDALFGRLLDGLAEEPPVSIRTNPAKCRLKPAGGQPVPWCGCGYWLPWRPAFTFDPLLHAGWYYVQESASMFLHRVISQYVTRPVRMLDLCAAPGGKSTCALGALPEGSVLMCNEPEPRRAHILAENIMKWGLPGVIVTNSLPRDYARSGLKFDVVLCDVPCSGEGMFRKDPASIGEWSAQNVERCAALQREIVAGAWQCLRPGGLLVYSTCTFNARENEENVAWICSELGAELLPADSDEAWGVGGSLSAALPGPVCRFIPGVSRSEGLFMAAMRKPADAGGTEPTTRRRQRKSRTPAAAPAQAAWLRRPADFDYFSGQDSIVAVPKSLTPLYDTAQDTLRVVHAGVTLGTLRGRDVVPHQSLALSVELADDAFPRAELTHDDAISYLRRLPVSLPEGTPRGFVLATCGGAALGFVKSLGARANNLYPQEWRIRSTHTPDGGLRPALFGSGWRPGNPQTTQEEQTEQR